MIVRWMVLWSAALLVGACSKPAALRSDLPAGSTLEASLAASRDAGSVTASTRPAAPLPAATGRSTPIHAHLPREAGSVVRAVERADGEDGERRILSPSSRDSLAENYVDLAYRSGPAGADAFAALKPSAASIAAELAREFPGVVMQVVPRPRYNAYGQYGLAIGRGSDGERCIYGWQWIDRTAISKVSPDAAYASVRVRLCRTDATVDQLAKHVERLDLRRDKGVTTAARPRRPRPVAGAEPASRVAAGPVARAENPVPVTPAAPPPTFPSGWSPSAAPGGPRYIAPAESAPARPAERPPVPGVPGSPDTARRSRLPEVGSSLPPEAFMGPPKASGTAVPAPAR